MLRKILISLLVIFAVLPLAMASNDLVSMNRIEVHNMNASGMPTVEAGQNVPIDLWFTPNENATDVEISAWIGTRRSERVDKRYGDLINGSQEYTYLNLRMPSDLDKIDEKLILYVRIESEEGNWEESYELRTKREPYKAYPIFVEVDRTVDAGSRVSVDVVIKNLGRHNLDDLVVTARIPGLDISRRAYFGDLYPVDEPDDNEYNARERRLYIDIPSDAKLGNYELFVETNMDTERVRKNIDVTGIGQKTNVVVPVSTRKVETGSTATYEMVIVNTGDNIGTYQIIPESVKGLSVSVDDSVITVPAGASRSVYVEAEAEDEDGTYTFSVDVRSESQTIGSETLTAEVTEEALPSNMVILTIVLAIIFIVLLIVLIVLLTRKPQSEELEESYY